MKLQRIIKFAVLSVATVVGACQSAESDGAPSSSGSEARCAEVIDKLKQCYPDLESDGKCTEETVAAFDSKNVASLDCGSMDNLGKADAFSFGGCGNDEHVCSFIFCCDNYTIGRYPQSAEWDIVDLVKDFQSVLPSNVESEQAALSRDQLVKGVSWTWSADVVEAKGGSAKKMAVELSQRIIEVPYAQFVQRLPAESWGIKLAYYIGGEVAVDQQDPQGRAVRQVERMVLSPFPCAIDLRIGNNDMTKAEVIEYGTERAKVFWRVYFSDNDSTEADVGSVEFSAYDASSTLVTFHSAHRLNAPGGVHIPTDAVELALKTYFLDHIAKYAQVVK